MKSKHSNKVLIPLVILIWIGVGASFLGWGENSSTQTETFASSQRELLVEDQEPEHLSLSLNYRDPFLDKLPALEKARSPRRQKKSPKLVKVVKAEPLRIPQLAYQGLVQGENEADRTAILQINKKTYTVRPGDSLQGIAIHSISHKQISIGIADTLIHIYP